MAGNVTTLVLEWWHHPLSLIEEFEKYI